MAGPARHTPLNKKKPGSILVGLATKVFPLCHNVFIDGKKNWAITPYQFDSDSTHASNAAHGPTSPPKKGKLVPTITHISFEKTYGLHTELREGVRSGPSLAPADSKCRFFEGTTCDSNVHRACCGSHVLHKTAAYNEKCSGDQKCQHWKTHPRPKEGHPAGQWKREASEMAKPEEHKLQKRATRACIPCKLGKRRCNHERPCGPCCARGLESDCVDEVKDVACIPCKLGKRKCNHDRPCGPCLSRGLELECVDAVNCRQRPSKIAAYPPSSCGEPELGRSSNMQVSEEEKLERRNAVACIPCKLGKRRCNHERPCEPCCARGLESECIDEVKEIGPACSMCKKRKLKCDRRRPCGRCSKQGRSAECIEDGNHSTAGLSASLLPESAANPDQALQAVLPNAGVLYESYESGSEDSVFTSASSAASTKPSQSMLLEASGLHGEGLPIVEPEHPVSFPSGVFNGWASVLPASSKHSPWPASLSRLFKVYRTADRLYTRILNHMPPKLLSSVMRIFRAIDVLVGLKQSASQSPPPPKEWNTEPSSSWHNSLRCGMLTVRVDLSGEVLSGVEVNSVWTDLAGLHREEFVSRAFNGELAMPTSELRQACKLFWGCGHVLRAQLQNEPKLEMKPQYSRVSRSWGRDGGSGSEGVLIRMRTTSVQAADGAWQTINHSSVVVAPAEYEAVRAVQPELCEGYLIPIVGSKSASQLMDPQLLVDESFEHMNASLEGRARLELLADHLNQEFQFLFDFLGKMGVRSSSGA